MMKRSYKKQLQRKKSLYLMIRYGLLAALIIVVIIFAGGRRESKAEFSSVANAVSATLSLDNMEQGTARYLKKNFGINAEDFENVMIYIPTSNMHAEEVVLIKLKSAAQADMVVEAIEERIASQLGIFAGYAPEQVALLEQAIVDPQGNYILYITGNDAEKADEAFRKSL